MSELLPITITSIVLACLSQRFTYKGSLSIGSSKKEKLFFSIMVICLVLFSGLRTDFNDTKTYLSVYANTSQTQPIKWSLGNNPGYQIVKRFCKQLNISGQTYLLLYAVFTLPVFLWFIRKYSPNFRLSIFLFLTTDCFLFTMTAVKQCAAIAFCLLAIDRYLKRERFRFVLYIILATLFHPYAWMFLIVPFLSFRPWSKKTFFLLIIFFSAGLALQKLLGTIVDITTMLGEEYSVDSLSGTGVNPFRLAVTAVPVILSFITRRVIKEENNTVMNLILNLSMLNTAIMFVGLFGTANYFGRLANYFLVFQMISIPWLLSHFEIKSRRLVTSAAIMGYSLFFIYSNAINIHFDVAHSSISLSQYIRSMIL